MDIIYRDNSIIVCNKPAGILSTDEPGGLPELIRNATGLTDVRTVHRLDRVVSGLMVLALNKNSASELSRQIREDDFAKHYLAVVHGDSGEGGLLEDLLIRSKEERKTYVTYTPSKESRPAALKYKTLAKRNGLSLVAIELITGRTHQIRCQFSSRQWPLVGDRKYSLNEDGCDIALRSYHLSFAHPETGEYSDFKLLPDFSTYPWKVFEDCREIVNDFTFVD